MSDESPNSGWDLVLKSKFKAFDVEKSIHSQNRNKANTSEQYAKFICDGLHDGDVPDNLHKLYIEAVYGTDSKVKKRILKRVYTIGQKSR